MHFQYYTHHDSHSKVKFTRVKLRTTVVQFQTFKAKCSFGKFYQIDNKTKEIIEENPKSIKENGTALVEIIPKHKPIFIESFQDCEPLGRFVIRFLDDIPHIWSVRRDHDVKSFGFGTVKEIY